MSRLRYRDAIWGDGISYIGQAVLVGLLSLRPASTLNEMFAVMAATSLAAAALQSWQIRAARATWTELRAAGTAFWDLGKWLVVGFLISTISGPIFPWLLNWFHGREAAATFQAVVNVLGISNPFIGSIPAIVMPAAANFVHHRGEYTSKSLLGLAMKYVVQLELIIGPLLLILALWPHAALTLFYGKQSIYLNETLALRAGVVAWLVMVPMTVFLAVLTGAGRTKRNAVVLGAGALAAVLFAPPLIFAEGTVGGMLATTVCRGACVLLGIWLLSSFSIRPGGKLKLAGDSPVPSGPGTNAAL